MKEVNKMSEVEVAAGAAYTFTRAGIGVMFMGMIPIAAVGMTIGISMWLLDNMIRIGSGGK